MINDIKKLLTWTNVTFQFALLLVVVLCLSFVDLIWFETNPQMRIQYIVNLITIFAISEGFYILNFYFFKLKNVNYLHLGITATIIFLVVHPTAPWYLYAITMALALLGKFTIRSRTGPVFNPAALGIGLGYLVSVVFVKLGFLKETLFESWWGADLQFSFFKFTPVLWIISVLLLAALFYFVKRFNKLNHGLAYYITYILISFLYFQVKGVPVVWNTYLLNIFTGSYVFLAFVMVTEPKTSPVMKNQQIWLGVVGGIILFVLSNVIPDFAPGLSVEIPTIVALLLLNAVTYFVKNQPMKPLPAVAATSAVRVPAPPAVPNPQQTTPQVV